MGWFGKRTRPPIEVRIQPHSIPEEHFYISKMACHACGAVGLERAMHEFPCTSHLSCPSCGQDHRVISDEALMMTPEYLGVLEDGSPETIQRYQGRFSHSAEKSRLFDLAFWVKSAAQCLARMYSVTDRGSLEYLEAKYVLVQAGAEALKFFGASDEPPLDAFYTPASRAAFEQARDSFHRSIVAPLVSGHRSIDAIEDDVFRLRKQRKDSAEGGRQSGGA